MVQKVLLDAHNAANLNQPAVHTSLPASNTKSSAAHNSETVTAAAATRHGTARTAQHGAHSTCRSAARNTPPPSPGPHLVWEAQVRNLPVAQRRGPVGRVVEYDVRLVRRSGWRVVFLPLAVVRVVAVGRAALLLCAAMGVAATTGEGRGGQQGYGRGRGKRKAMRGRRGARGGGGQCCEVAPGCCSHGAGR